MTTTIDLNEEKLAAFLERAFADLSACYGGVMVSLGDRLGLYRALAGAGPLTSAELAERAGCAERYVREWLGSQVAAAYVDYDAETETYELPAEHAAVLADPDSPTLVTPPTTSRRRCGATKSRLPGRFAPARESRGEPTPTASSAGWPNSTFFGVDPHEGSIAAAIENAAAAGVSDRVSFSVGTAADYKQHGFDLICFFDALHDMGDPVGAARHARSALAEGGTVMLVEPFAANRVEDNEGPISRAYYSASATLCCAHALSEGGQDVLGAQAGEARLGDVFAEAGFTHWRLAEQTPFNLILEARA